MPPGMHERRYTLLLNDGATCLLSLLSPQVQHGLCPEVCINAMKYPLNSRS